MINKPGAVFSALKKKKPACGRIINLSVHSASNIKENVEVDVFCRGHQKSANIWADSW